MTAALVLTVAAVVLAGCIPPPPPPPAALTPMTIGVTHAVGTKQFTFVDTTRSTPAFGGYPGSPSRTIPTSVWYPSDGGGPFPLVMFAHGWGVTPANYAALLQKIAAAGYVVAAPTYPLLSGQPAGPTDQVGFDDLFPDTWYVTTQMLSLSSSGDPQLGGLIDPTRIAVAGHSDGALIAWGDGYVPFKLDPRVRGVIAYAADLEYYGYYQPNGRPILHFLNDNDEYNPYPAAIAWDRTRLQEPKTTVTLWNATHAPPYMDPNDPHADLVARFTVGWLDSVLKAHPEALLAAYFYVVDHPSLALIG